MSTLGYPICKYLHISNMLHMLVPPTNHQLLVYYIVHPSRSSLFKLPRKNPWLLQQPSPRNRRNKSSTSSALGVPLLLMVVRMARKRTKQKSKTSATLLARGQHLNDFRTPNSRESAYICKRLQRTPKSRDSKTWGPWIYSNLSPNLTVSPNNSRASMWPL